MPTHDTGSCPMCAALTGRQTNRRWHVPNCCTHGLNGARPNELRVFCGDAFHAQSVFNCSALPKFNTGPSKCTAAPGTNRALSAPCVTSSVAVDGKQNAETRPSMSAKFRHCSGFWTKANGLADNFNGFRKCAHLCGLTFELSGLQRRVTLGPE